MDSIALPSKVEFTAGADEQSGSLVIEPLYPGYGTTIGNALRRVLLSSLPGAAVTAVNIHGAPHEFTTLPQVQEDILQIILNLKQLRLRVFSEEPIKLRLSVKGERVATAADIEPNSDVEIINEELPIAALTSRNASLEMDIWVGQGRGYVPTEAREKERLELGTIAIDALYSPVRQVSFRVEPARVGQMTNFDRLILDVETDGTVSGTAALRAATGVLIGHFNLLATALQSAPVEAEDRAADVIVPPAPDPSAESPEDGEPKRRTRKKQAE